LFEPKRYQWTIKRTIVNNDINNFLLAYKYNPDDDNHKTEKALCDFLDYLVKNA